MYKNIRKLNLKDIDFMNEWMKDDDINKNFRYNFSNTTKDEMIEFIKNSYDDKNIHMAIVDNLDDYMGTISLKNISIIDKNAEYAIVLRKKAIGTGLALLATIDILNYAFSVLKLEKVYLNVYSDNLRAIKFYEKVGFNFEGEFIKHVMHNNELKNIKWYAIYKGDVNFDKI